jgi:hypothetical protein
MWTPEIIFCIATQCWLAQAPPQDTKDLCQDYLLTVLVPTLQLTAPEALILVVRCDPPGIPT